MTPSLTSRLTIAGVLLATLGLPAAAAAQYQLPTLTSSARADSLHEAADALVAAHRWGDAARLHRRSAELRDADDPLGFRCLKEAAALAYATGDRSGARADMADAAAHALARGDLREAGLAYVDAAWIAQEQGKPRQVWELGPPGRDAGGLAAAGGCRSGGDPEADRAGAGGGAGRDAAGAVATLPHSRLGRQPGGREGYAHGYV